MTPLSDIALPPDVEAAARAYDAARRGPSTEETPIKPPEVTDRLAALTSVLVSKRQEAIDARRNSGIEHEWLLCEEAYAGIDDANRHEFRHYRWEKATSLQGPALAAGDPRAETADEIRSTVYPRLTARYVQAAAAKLNEILFPADERAYALEPTPVPDLIKMRESGDEQVVIDGIPLERDPRPHERPDLARPPWAGQPPVPPGQTPSAPSLPAQAPGRPLTYRDLAEETMAKARQRAKAAENRIHDWLVEAKYVREARKVIFDAARLGVGVLKGPVPKLVRRQVVERVTDEAGRPALRLTIKEQVVPTVKRVNPWNIFPDPACGEDIHEGDYIFERDYLSPKAVKLLKTQPYYHAAAIDQVLREGPQKLYLAEDRRRPEQQERQYEIWYFHGMLHREDFALLNPAQAADVSEDLDQVPVVATLINDTVVRAVLAPLDSGALPYHAMPWEYREGHWAGVGVAEQVRVPQRILTGATRAMMNNAGKSAGSQIVVDETAIQPADGEPVLTPDKLWKLVSGATHDDVRKAMTVFTIPNHTPALMQIVDYAFRLAEESTNMPLITQGMSGATAPETFGAAQLQQNNANQLLRNLGYTYDEYVTEPLIRAYYEWLLLDPEVPEEEKGDWEIHAHGSSALVERAIQDQALVQLSQVVLSGADAFGVDPKKWLALMLKSKRLDPREVQYTPEELAQRANAQTPPPELMREQIRAEIEKYKADLKAQSDEADRQLQRELTGLAAQVSQQPPTGLSEPEVQLRLAELQAKRDLALLEYANRRQITLDQAKAKLAETAMKLRVQRELAALDRAAEGVNPPQVAAPPIEPPGRAAPGRAYQE